MAKKFDFKTMKLSDIPNFIKAVISGDIKKKDEMMTGQTGKYEINLVPDVKLEMIRLLKVRNLVFFVCVVAAAASIVFALVLGSIRGGQEIVANSQNSHLEKLSKVVLSYGELPEFLTLQNQLSGVNAVNDKRKVLSRVFNFVTSLMPTNGDSVTLSEVTVNLKNSTISFDAQANAGVAPDIDYRVLEAFMKNTNLMKYDYGRYVDAEGNEIPTRCIVERDESGNLLSEGGSVYGIWQRGKVGCDPKRDDYAKVAAADTSSDSLKNGTANSEVANTEYSKSANAKEGGFGTLIKTTKTYKVEKKQDGTEDKKELAVSEVATIVPDERIWRTPQFKAWHNGEKQETSKDGLADKIESSSENKTEGEGDNAKTVNKVKNVMKYSYTPAMSVDGTISGVPHFDSKCIKYTGQEVAAVNGASELRWSANNDCMMVPDGIKVTDSSNGRDSDDNLVLRFTASITFADEIFAYNNKHVIAISPSGQNVTDSFKQIEGMFSAPAMDCRADDATCNAANNKKVKEGN